MSHEMHASLRTALKGSTIVFAGMMVSNLLWFAIKVLLVRSMTVEEFGIYNLVLTIAGVLSAVAHLGIPEGTTRYVSVFLGQGRKDDAAAVARSSLHLSVAAGLTVAALLYLCSDVAAHHVFYKPGLSHPLRILSVFIPLSMMAMVSTNILRGHTLVRPRVYFLDLGHPLFYLVLLGSVLFLGLSFDAVLYSYVLAMAMVFISLAAYQFHATGLPPLPLRGGRHSGELLRFSLPLLFASIAGMVLSWTDTLMLGRYTAIENVGVYGVAFSLVKLLLFPLQALGFIFLPLAGEMHARRQTVELRRSYQVLTKWVFAATLPVFFVLFFFPEMTITFLFGEHLVDAALPLRILALAYLFHVFLGANQILMTAMNMTRAVMNISLFTAALNIVLNYLLIKRAGMGIMGAAVSTAVSYVVLNVLNSTVLYRRSGVHPITSRYLKPLAATFPIGLALYAVAKSLPLYFWMMPLYLLLFVGGYLGSLLVSRSIEEEDAALFDAVARRTGLPLGGLRRLVERFRHR